MQRVPEARDQHVASRQATVKFQLKYKTAQKRRFLYNSKLKHTAQLLHKCVFVSFSPF